MGIERRVNNPTSGFSDVVTVSGAGRLIYVSGTVGSADGETVVVGGMDAEARATFANIARTLDAVGAGMSEIIKITAFITDLDAYPLYAKVRAEVFGRELPASSTVQVAGLLAGAQIEIEAVAFLPVE